MIQRDRGDGALGWTGPVLLAGGATRAPAREDREA